MTDDDKMLPEYDFSGGERGKYVRANRSKLARAFIDDFGDDARWASIERYEAAVRDLDALLAETEKPGFVTADRLRSLLTELWDGVRIHGLEAPTEAREPGEGARLIHAYCGGIVRAREERDEAVAELKAKILVLQRLQHERDLALERWQKIRNAMADSSTDTEITLRAENEELKAKVNHLKRDNENLRNTATGDEHWDHNLANFIDRIRKGEWLSVIVSLNLMSQEAARRLGEKVKTEAPSTAVDLEDNWPPWTERGSVVYYHPIIGGPADIKPWRIRDRGHLGDGSAVVWLYGKAGCVALRAVTPMP